MYRALEVYMHVYTYFLHDSKTRLVLNNGRQGVVQVYMSLVNPVLLSKDKMLYIQLKFINQN